MQGFISASLFMCAYFPVIDREMWEMGFVGLSVRVQRYMYMYPWAKLLIVCCEKLMTDCSMSWDWKSRQIEACMHRIQSMQQ